MGDYMTRKDRMAQYLAKAKELLSKFSKYKLYQIGDDKNAYTNALAKLVAALKSGLKWTSHVETLANLSIFKKKSRL